MPTKVSIILGTRPQIIKSAPVYQALSKAGIECEIINTGQHYDYEMNRGFFSELRLPEPAADLNVGQGTPNEQVSAIVGGLGGLFQKSKPDLAVVPGDTNSALAAGIACSKSGVKVAHLESGCRSGDIRMAEEINRRVLDHMSQVLLCPTPACVRNVRSEHVLADSVSFVGDTMYDSLLRYKPGLKKSGAAAETGVSGKFAFMTLHRAETVDDEGALRRILGAVASLGLTVVFSVHPRTRERLSRFSIKVGPSVMLVDPLPYLDTLSLVAKSEFVITDSGGLQKEAYWLGRPGLIARDTTEWGEVVRAGAAFLVGTDEKRILRGYAKVKKVGRAPFTKSRSIFGDGHASERVAAVLKKYVGD